MPGRHFTVAELNLLFCYGIGFFLLWTPSSLLVRRLGGSEGQPTPFSDVFTLIVAAAASYLAFWVYLISPLLGALGSYLVLGTGVAWPLWTYRHRLAGMGELFSVPVRITFLFGLLYLSGSSMFGGVDKASTWFVPEAFEDPAASLFWLNPRSIDSLIPLKFAYAVAHDDPLRGDIRFGIWQFSDRPPLQTGSLLLFWPLTKVFGCSIVGLAIGVLLQVQWVLAVFALAWALGSAWRRAEFVVLTVGTAGFVYFSSVYVWPKLLAGGLWLAALVPLVRAWQERRAPRLTEAMLAASGSTLALLAHGSIGFSLLPTAMVALAYRPFRSWRFWLPGVVVALAIYLPWIGYQRFADPPGDHCLRLMFAGVLDSDDRSWTTTVAKAYGQSSWGEVLAARKRNFFLLFSDRHLDHNIAECVAGILNPRTEVTGSRGPFINRYYCKASQLKYDLQTVAVLLRYDQVEETFRALGLLNLAWPLLLWRGIRSRGKYLRQRGLGLLLLLTGLSLLVWWLLIFQHLLIRNASHGMMLGLLMIAALVVYDSCRAVRWTIFAHHLLLNVVLWVVLVPTDFARVHLQLAAWPCLAPLSGALLAILGLVRCAKRPAWGEVPKPEPVPGTNIATRQHAAVVGFLVLLVAVSSAAIYRHRLLDAGPDPETQPGTSGPDTSGPDTSSLGTMCKVGGDLVEVSYRSVSRPEMLSDGVSDDSRNYAMVPFSTPMEMRFKVPQVLTKIRLFLYDFGQRTYKFTVKGETGGSWIMLRDSSQNSEHGLVVIPAGGREFTAIRIQGIYNSNMEHNPRNRRLHLKELELVP